MSLAQQKDLVFPGHCNLRSRATAQQQNPPLLLHLSFLQRRHRTQRRTHALTRPTTTRTCWPDLLPRGEMRSNSAFQHTTSDYPFSVPRANFPETHVIFPFRYGTLHLSVSPTRLWRKIMKKNKPGLHLYCAVMLRYIIYPESVLSHIAVIYCTRFIFYYYYYY